MNQMIWRLGSLSGNILTWLNRSKCAGQNYFAFCSYSLGFSARSCNLPRTVSIFIDFLRVLSNLRRFLGN